jgi:DNA replication and repair protein RecF
MEIDSLEMISFRNHEKTKIEFGPGLTILWGKNGSGKTSILEAIHSLSLGKSFRTNNKKEMVKNGKNSFLLRGFFKKAQGNESMVSFSQDRIGNKKIKINKKTITKRKELLGLNSVVVFSPEEESITKGPPGERRKFFNKVFSICSKTYLEKLLTYNKILKQRNAVLKNNHKKQSTIEELDTWSEPLADAGEKLWRERTQLIKEFTGEFSHITKELDEKIKKRIIYKEKKTDREEILQQIKNNNTLDIKNGFTSYGPHRDDFLFLWNKKPIRKQGSQGEHKLFLALLKITELLFLSKKTKKNPIFLIDDLFASLDEKKSKKLLAFIGQLQTIRKKRPQTIITTTDFAGPEKNGFFLGFEEVKKHHIHKNGNT